jgi:hypothetical protein
MISMVASPPNGIPSDREKYRRSFRKQVFRLLGMGYRRLEANKYSEEEETSITGELVKSIRDVIEDAESPRNLSRYSIHDDEPLNVAGRLGKRRRRIDIEFERTGHGPHPRFSFESKRLNDHGHNVAQYIGKDGLLLFMQGEYGKCSAEAGMLGYVQSGTRESWAKKLADGIEKNKAALKISRGGGWKATAEFLSLSHCYRTTHERRKLRKPIQIYHVLLDFCK